LCTDKVVQCHHLTGPSAASSSSQQCCCIIAIVEFIIIVNLVNVVSLGLVCGFISTSAFFYCTTSRQLQKIGSCHKLSEDSINPVLLVNHQHKAISLIKEVCHPVAQWILV
jgi:hypothetical protein